MKKAVKSASPKAKSAVPAPALTTPGLTTPGVGGRRAFVSRQTKETRIAAENVRLEQDARANQIREHSSAEGVRVRAQQDAHNALVVAKIAESTAASKAAEVEANHANLKIENLNQRLLDSQTLATTSATEARTVGDDTLAHVHTLVTKVDEQASVGQATHALVEHIDAKVSDPKK